jgi:hypothetical protein
VVVIDSLANSLNQVSKVGVGDVGGVLGIVGLEKQLLHIVPDYEDLSAFLD